MDIATTRIGTAKGEPALVIPGGPCRGPEYLGDLADVGESHALVVMHPRGTPLTGGLSRGWWTDADDVIAVADRLMLDDVHVVAHSAGTYLALAAAARFPDRVASLALITPAAMWLTGAEYDGDFIAAARPEPEIREAMVSLHAPEPDTEQAFDEAFLVQAPAGYAHWGPTEQAHATVGTVSLAAELAWFADIPDDAIDRIKAAELPPTFVIGGAQDLLVGIEPVKKFAEVLGASLEMIEDCGHYPWVEKPGAFRATLESWLGRDFW